MISMKTELSCGLIKTNNEDRYASPQNYNDRSDAVIAHGHLYGPIDK